MGRAGLSHESISGGGGDVADESVIKGARDVAVWWLKLGGGRRRIGKRLGEGGGGLGGRLEVRGVERHDMKECTSGHDFSALGSQGLPLQSMHLKRGRQ